MPSPSNTDPSARSGILKLANGSSVIPSSTRPDGSVRKEIKVKPGYKPPEDVEVYKNRTAAAWKNRGTGGVPGAEAVEKESEGASSAAANKNAKRREARKKAAAASGESVDSTKKSGAVDEKKTELEEVDPEAEKAKEAKKLAKKLRQARDLQDKKEKGDSLLPEQFAKVIKTSELIRQLEALGFDAEGEKKTNGDKVTKGDEIGAAALEG